MALSGSQLAYKHARLGVLRLGAGRLNYFTPIEVKLTVNGTDRSSLGRFDSFSVTLNAYDQPDTCTGKIWGAAGFTPDVGQTLVLGMGQAENRVFGGRIVRCTQCYDGGLPSLMYYDIRAIDGSRTLGKRRVRTRYVNADAAEIVFDLVATYSSGITTAHVETSLGVIDDISFTMETLPTALTRVAERIPGCRWFVDAYNDLHFGTTLPVTPAPAPLTNSSAIEFKNVRRTRDILQVATRVYVEGRGGKLTEFQSPLPADPNLYVDTPSEIFDDPGAGTNYVRLRTMVLPYVGLTDTGFDHLEGTLAGAAIATASSEPRAREGDDINIWVQRDDTSAQAALAALEGGDGIRETYIVDRRLSQAGCEQRGDDELARTATVLETLSYDTTDVNALPGRDVVVNLVGTFAISGTFRIQTVTIDKFGAVPGQASPVARGMFPWRHVEATIARRLTAWDALKQMQSPTFWSLS